MPFILLMIVFVLGLAVGSFLNVVVCRLELTENRSRKIFRERFSVGLQKFFGNRSRCPRCGQVLRWYDLIPVASFIWLRGKCRYCGQKISWQYPLVEIATGLLFLLVFNNLTLSLPLIRGGVGRGEFSIFDLASFCYLLYVFCSLIVIFVYDLRRYIIPDKIIFPAIIVSLIYRLGNAFFNPSLPSLNLRGGWVGLYPYLLSAFAAAAFFAAIIILTRGRGLGWGDVKLAFLMGLVLGWPDIFLALFLAFLSGALTGVGLIIAGRKQLKSQIPFGPFLAAATIFVALFGEPLA
ncbi:MAG: hypothetical protein COS30_00285, partial [Candidatus Portnoybacteria bacterium CG02_land_8_20_14_3_00_45_8]